MSIRAAALPFVLTIALGMSCSDGEPVRASIVTKLAAPRTLLERAKTVELRVLEGGEAKCDDKTGDIANVTTAKEVIRRELGTSNCAAGARFCGEVTIPKSDAVRTFEAKAKDGATVLAVGCAEAKADQDAVPLTIKMFRFLEPAACGDGTIQPKEQCEPGGSALCDEACQSNEILLSIGDSGNHTQTSTAGKKTEPFFLWPANAGTQGRFFAFFTDRAVPAGANNIEVGLRVMGPDLLPVNSPPALAKGSIFLTNNQPFPSDAAPGQQSLPQATLFQGKYYVVFQDDNSPGSFGLDIHLRTLNDVLQSDQGVDPIAVNGSGGEANIQTAPAIAAGKDRVFVAWEDQSGGKIVGRTVAAGGTLGSQNELSTGTGNSRPWVAATANGWVAVWKSGTGIKLRTINASGTPEGTEQVVNDSGAGADGARVASLPDGRFAVVWSANGDVFMQRYDAKGVKLPGDQGAPLNDVVTEGDQTAPAIASTPAVGGSYAIAWHDGSSSHIRARFAGGTSGFLFNNVNGQATEFQASRVDGRTRAAPTVAVGGAGPFVAIGWEDRATSNAGVIARRFPLPSE
jgi:hypothetical protein